MADSSTVKCLITGVTLHEVNTDVLKPGDLFQAGSTCVVNAAGQGEIRELREGEKVVSYNCNDNYFARRNVYVFPQATLRFNQAALDYIKKAPHDPA